MHYGQCSPGHQQHFLCRELKHNQMQSALLVNWKFSEFRMSYFQKGTRLSTMQPWLGPSGIVITKIQLNSEETILFLKVFYFFFTSCSPSFIPTPPSFYFAHLFSPQCCTAVSKCAHCTEISPFARLYEKCSTFIIRGKRAWSCAQTGF